MVNNCFDDENEGAAIILSENVDCLLAGDGF